MQGDSSSNEAACEQLIWQSNPEALRQQPLTSRGSWAGAVQHDLVSFGLDGQLRLPGRAGEPYLGAAMVMMAKDEADIIGENLTWHYAAGLRRFIFIDNGSTDETAVIIKRFQRLRLDAEVIVVNDPIVRYMQAEKTTGLYRLALSIWPDIRWVIPADADEFLVATDGLSVLDDVPNGIDALSVAKVIHFRELGRPFNGRSRMEQMTVRSPPFCVPPKIIARHDLFLTITQGNHKVRLVDNRVPVYAGAFGHGLYYREFPTRSFEQFLRKVRNGGPAIKAAEAFLGHKVGGEHWIKYHDELLAGGEEHLLGVYQRDWIRDVSNGFVHDLFSVDASHLH